MTDLEHELCSAINEIVIQGARQNNNIIIEVPEEDIVELHRVKSEWLHSVVKRDRKRGIRGWILRSLLQS